MYMIEVGLQFVWLYVNTLENIRTLIYRTKVYLDDSNIAESTSHYLFHDLSPTPIDERAEFSNFQVYGPADITSGRPRSKIESMCSTYEGVYTGYRKGLRKVLTDAREACHVAGVTVPTPFTIEVPLMGWGLSDENRIAWDRQTMSKYLVRDDTVQLAFSRFNERFTQNRVAVQMTDNDLDVARNDVNRWIDTLNGSYSHHVRRPQEKTDLIRRHYIICKYVTGIQGALSKRKEAAGALMREERTAYANASENKKILTPSGEERNVPRREDRGTPVRSATQREVIHVETVDDHDESDPEPFESNGGVFTMPSTPSFASSPPSDVSRVRFDMGSSSAATTRATAQRTSPGTVPVADSTSGGNPSRALDFKDDEKMPASDINVLIRVMETGMEGLRSGLILDFPTLISVLTSQYNAKSSSGTGKRGRDDL
jgi:hypothetical protein